MEPLVVINDLHLSALRVAGTTPTTALQLRQGINTEFKRLLSLCDCDVLINGDFADSYRMVASDMLEAYNIMAEWLEKGHKLYAAPGNHCLSKSSLDLSSFELLFRLLESQFPEQVALMMKPGPIRDSMYVLPHVANQDLLDLELSKVPACKYLFVHANYDNKFATQSDHSLNISKEQAEASQAETIIFGHEHQGRVALAGKVIVSGKQIPTSVADCLGSNFQYLLKLSDSGVEKVQVWSAADDFARMDWQALADTEARFVRVEGSATSEQAAEVVSTIAKYRASSKALVISNAVQIAGLQNDAQISLEQVRGFNVFDALLSFLTEPEQVKVRKLYEEHYAKAD